MSNKWKSGVNLGGLEEERNRALELLEEHGEPAGWYSITDPNNIMARTKSLLDECRSRQNYCPECGTPHPKRIANPDYLCKACANKPEATVREKVDGQLSRIAPYPEIELSHLKIIVQDLADEIDKQNARR